MVMYPLWALKWPPALLLVRHVCQTLGFLNTTAFFFHERGVKVPEHDFSNSLLKISSEFSMVRVIPIVGHHVTTSSDPRSILKWTPCYNVGLRATMLHTSTVENNLVKRACHCNIVTIILR